MFNSMKQKDLVVSPNFVAQLDPTEELEMQKIGSNGCLPGSSTPDVKQPKAPVGAVPKVCALHCSP